MPELSPETLVAYLQSVLGQTVHVIGLSPLGEPLQAGAIKGYGYGVPIQVEYEVSGKRHRAVVETIHPGHFGHQHMADRAQALLWDHWTFNRLPRHARSLDVAAFQIDGRRDISRL